MKSLLLLSLLFFAYPVNAHDFNSRHGEDKKCYEKIYKEKYIPGNSTIPGYVESYEEFILVSFESDGNVLNQYHLRPEKQISNKQNKTIPNCSGRTTAGGLIGGGIAASLSKSDAYSWSIPLGAVLGAGIGNNECK